MRDPLLTLGLRDPVERIAEIKANDPKRRALVELFDLWHKKHKEEPVRAAQLDPEIIQLIDIRARKKDDGPPVQPPEGRPFPHPARRHPRRRVCAAARRGRTTRQEICRLHAGQNHPRSGRLHPCPSPRLAAEKCERPMSCEPGNEAAATGEAFEIVGQAPAGSRCYLCGKGRRVYLIRRENNHEADQVHLDCAKKANDTNAANGKGLP